MPSKKAKQASFTKFKQTRPYAYKGPEIVQCFTFLLIVLMVGALGYFFFWSYLITIPLILLPFLFATQASISEMVGKNELDNRKIFFFYKEYFNPSGPFYGVYRFFNCLWKSLLFFIATSFIFTLIYIGFASIADSGFYSSLTELEAILTSQESTVSELNSFLAAHPLVNLYEELTMFVNFGLTFYFFLHLVGQNFFSPVVRGACFQLGVRGANTVFANFLRHEGISYRQRYYRYFYLGPIIYAISYVGGIFLARLWSTDVTSITSFAFSLSLCVLTFYLPYMFKGTDSLSEEYEDRLSLEQLDLIKKAFSMYQESENVRQEDLENLKTVLKQAEEEEKKIREKEASEEADESKEDEKK